MLIQVLYITVHNTFIRNTYYKSIIHSIYALKKRQSNNSIIFIETQITIHYIGKSPKNLDRFIDLPNRE